MIITTLLTRIHIWCNTFLINKVIPFSSRLGLALPIALVWRFVTIPFQGYTKDRDKRANCFLVLDKTGLTGDLLEVFPPDNTDVYLLSLPREAVKSIARMFLPPTLTDVSYLTDDRNANEAKVKYRRFLYKVWRWYGALIKIDGVLVANYSFYAERELAAAVEKNGVPFFALHKECVAPRIMWNGYEDNCRDEKGPFTGRAMTVYNNEWKDIMIRAGVIGADCIKSVGCPRMDVYHQHRIKGRSTKGKLVTLFSFLPTSGLPYIGGGEKEIRWPVEMLLNGEKWSWDSLARESHRAIVELALERPDISFVIKIKVGKAYLNYINDFLDCELPFNVKIVQGGEAEQYILDSVVITGFNSTTLFEGIAAGKAVVVPRFAEAGIAETANGILDLGESAFWAESTEHYKQLIKDNIDEPLQTKVELSAAAKNVLEKYVGNADGLAGKRMREFILSKVI